MMATPCNRYMEMQVQTAPAENLVLMLYDGALRFARQAQVDLTEGRMQDAHNDLTRAQDILGELMSSLNMDAGDIAQNLFKLYEFIQYRLIVANVRAVSWAEMEMKLSCADSRSISTGAERMS